MNLYSISLRNIREHRTRFLALTLALTIAIAAVLCLNNLSQAMHGDLQNKIDEFGANMVIVPKTKSLPLTYAGVTIGFVQSQNKLLTESDVAKIRTIPNRANINVVSPKLLGIVSVDGKKSLIAGVQFKDEFKLKQWWKIKNGERPDSATDAIAGGKIARVYGLTVGDSININGKRFNVAGILSMVGSQEDELLYVGLNEAQQILNMPGKLSVVEVSAWCKDCPIDDIVAQLSGKIPAGKISAVRQAAELRDSIIGQFKLFSIVLSITMALLAALVVFTNVLGSVRERRKEIGILRAIGYRRTHILRIILFETMLLGLVSGTTGCFVGFAAAFLLAPLVIGIDAGFAFNPVYAFSGIGSALIISMAASLYPALKAAQLNPAETIVSV